MLRKLWPLLARLKKWAQALRREVFALYLAMRDPNVPWYAKTLAAIIAGYALSPIDLIPDFIPVIGYLDDVLLLPLGILLTVRLIPRDVMEDLRRQAAAMEENRPPKCMTAAVIIVAIWILLLCGTVLLLAPTLSR